MAEQPITVVQCLACGHVATLSREQDDVPMVRLTRRLVCSVCGRRTMKVERVAPTPPSDKPRKH